LRLQVGYIYFWPKEVFEVHTRAANNGTHSRREKSARHVNSSVNAAPSEVTSLGRTPSGFMSAKIVQSDTINDNHHDEKRNLSLPDVIRESSVFLICHGFGGW
jgi:hypothetical protein